MVRPAADLANIFGRVNHFRPLLNGIFPVIKPLDINYIDFLDQVRLCLEFEVGFRFSPYSISYDMAPYLRKKESGIINVAFGSSAPHLANFKYSIVKSKLAIKIGERDPLTVFTPERQKRLGIVDDMQLCKPYDHVTPEQVKAAIDSFVGKFLQYRANKERDTREIVTELNYKKLKRHGPQVFREAPPPKPVTIHSVERVDCSQLPIILVDLTTCGSFCREKFAFDVGVKLSTYAKLLNALIYKFGEISIEEALEPYDIEWNRINCVMEKTSSRYSRMCQELAVVGRPTHMRFRCPWK